jgi:cytochrome c-type biogenesis protein CcsB
MPNAALAEVSNTLFVYAVIIYAGAAVGYFFRLAFTRISASGAQAPTRTGRRIGAAATAATVVGALAHTGSVVLRGVASGRPPLLNMYEFSSLIALVAVIATLVFVQWRMRQTDVVGFVLAGVVLTMGAALRLFVDAGPVQPALDTWWRWIHVSAIGLASAVFLVGFVFAALYLVKDTAERRVAATGDFGPGSAGAAQAPLANRGVPGLAPDSGDMGEADDHDRLDRFAQRDMLSWRPFVAAPFALTAAGTLILGEPVATVLGYAAILAGLGAVTWWSVPYLPAAGTLDTLAYRVNAFGFPVWTFAVIMGAMWAEVAWGRYWGWDPKETSAFFTWVFYAGYLHARSTRGWQGRRAAWVNVVAYVSLIVTYYVVNLVVVGLHSYAT